MALTKDQIKTDYPLPLYNYKVDIGNTTIGFSEISGLELAHEMITYKESPTASGKEGPNVMYMPGFRGNYNITMKKGYVKGVSVPVLYDWINSIELNRIDKKDITVHLLDEKGETVVSWKCMDCFPIKLSAPTFDANSSEVAIESMELVAYGLQMDEA